VVEETTTSGDITRTAARGAIALGLRQIIVKVSTLVAGIILARILEPAEFAIWGITNYVLTFLTSFGDAGLGASLIRQPHAPEEKDYQAIFTLQQSMVFTVVLAAWAVSPWLTGLYDLAPHNVWIFRCVALSLLLTSFMVIPQIRLERKLGFDKLSIVEISQSLIYNGSVVLLALNGLKELSFGVALLLRALVGVALVYWVSPWKITWLWDWPRIRSHLGFGLPFQGAKIVGLLKDLVNPAFFAVIAGTTAVGYINWATMVMNYPLLAVALLERLYMPLFARLAHDRENFNRVLHKIVSVSSLVVYTLSALLFVFRYEITTTVFGTQWLEALVLALPFVLISVILTPISIATNVLNALGHSNLIFWTMIASALCTWLVGGFSVVYFGWQAWGWANLAVTLLYLWLLVPVTRYTSFSWLNALTLPLIIALATGGLATALATFLPWTVALGSSLLAAAGASYKLWLGALRTLWSSRGSSRANP
jgi:O-antigen/teichoic acid export membrane protein